MRLRRERRADPLRVEERPTRVGRKPRRKWCRGKVGVLHTPVWVDHLTGGVLAIGGVQQGRSTPWWLVYRCTRCGKHLDTWLDILSSGPRPVVGSTEARS